MRTWVLDDAAALGVTASVYRAGAAYAGVAAVHRRAHTQAAQRRVFAIISGMALAALLGSVVLALGERSGLSLSLWERAGVREGGGPYSAYRPAGGMTALTLIAGGLSSLAGPVLAAPPQPPPPAPPAPAAAPSSVLTPPTADHTIVAPPSVDAALIDAVLQQYNSPAAGQGQAFFDLGLKYGVDPAYALAFFIHESSAGTRGVARFTNSIGNIRVTPGYRDYEGYRAYDTWAAGIEDWYKLIRDLYVDGWGKRTVAAIIPTYAPAADHNDPTAYITAVTSLVDSWQQK